MKVAISQSNYIPWVGYFYLIKSAESFVFLESVQYTKRDWRNRNLIKTPQGSLWMSIPVESMPYKEFQSISDMTFKDAEWSNYHLKVLERNYKKSNGFKEVFPILQALYKFQTSSLSEFNTHSIKTIARLMDIETNFDIDSNILPIYELRTLSSSERLATIVKRLGGSTYLTTPNAQAYLDVSAFKSLDIAIEWITYPKFDSYPQLWGNFIENLSVIDLLFNLGTAGSREYLHHSFKA